MSSGEGAGTSAGRSIVLGYDRAPGAQRALDIAIDLAKGFDLPLVIVHGVAPPGYVGEEATEAREAIGELDQSFIAPAVAAAEAAGARVTVEVLDDKPAQALVAAADRHDARVIVVGTWNESPLRGLILGSVAHRLLQLSDRPVLCVPAAADDAGE